MPTLVLKNVNKEGGAIYGDVADNCGPPLGFRVVFVTITGGEYGRNIYHVARESSWYMHFDTVLVESWLNG